MGSGADGAPGSSSPWAAYFGRPLNKEPIVLSKTPASDASMSSHLTEQSSSAVSQARNHHMKMSKLIRSSMKSNHPLSPSVSSAPTQASAVFQHHQPYNRRAAATGSYVWGKVNMNGDLNFANFEPWDHPEMFAKHLGQFSQMPTSAFAAPEISASKGRSNDFHQPAPLPAITSHSRRRSSSEKSTPTGSHASAPSVVSTSALPSTTHPADSHGGQKACIICQLTEQLVDVPEVGTLCQNCIYAHGGAEYFRLTGEHLN